MDCIVVAGGIPAPDSPLFPYTQGKPKALLPINGRLMVDYVIDALRHAHDIEKIVVVGLPAELYTPNWEDVHLLPDHGGLIANGLAGIRRLKSDRKEGRPIVLCSADIPLITPSIVNQILAKCDPKKYGLIYHMVTRQIMETRFPNSKRTFVKLKGVEIAGADLLMVHSDIAELNEELWVTLTNSRKHAWQLARVIGFSFLFKFLFRQVGIREIEETAVKIIKQPAKIILTPHAEIGMDVDKPYQIEYIRKEMLNYEPS